MEKTTTEMELEDVRDVSIPSNELPVDTTPEDVSTFLVDGIKGVSVVNGVARLNFIEIYADTVSDGLKGRHVVSLAIPTGVLPNLLVHLNHVLETLSPAPSAAGSEDQSGTANGHDG